MNELNIDIFIFKAEYKVNAFWLSMALLMTCSMNFSDD